MAQNLDTTGTKAINKVADTLKQSLHLSGHLDRAYVTRAASEQRGWLIGREEVQAHFVDW